jgi:hypothetical protein
MEHEKLGQDSTTDLLIISLSANDILVHKVGPNSEESRAMVAALDRQLADFFSYVGKQVGPDNAWFALSADHGVAPAPSYVSDLHIPGAYLGQEQLRITLNNQLRGKLRKSAATPAKATSLTASGKEPEFVPRMDWPLIMLDEKAFRDANVSEADAEKMVADFFRPYASGSYTRAQLMAGQVPPTAMGQRYANSLSPKAGWFVYMTSLPFFVGGTGGADHAMPYSYDMHVPVAFYGVPFQPGVYRGACEPVDMAVTLANLLGINSPSAAVGHVLTEALKPASATREAGR